MGVSTDSSFVLVSEFTGSRITKYWLTGPKADTAELLADKPGPANMKLNMPGDYWVATNVGTPMVPTAMRMDKNGKILETISFDGPPYNGNAITEVHEDLGDLYLGTIYVDFVAVHEGVTADKKTNLLGAAAKLAEEFYPY